jgi:hypothetical protein
VRIAVTGGINGNAGGKIKKYIAIHIMNPQSFGLIDDQRVNTGV